MVIYYDSPQAFGIYPVGVLRHYAACLSVFLSLAAWAANDRNTLKHALRSQRSQRPPPE